MFFTKLKEKISLLALVLFSVAFMSACSDKDDEPAVSPENPELPYIGAWLWEWDDDDDVQILVLDEPSRATLYETTSKLYKEGKYEDKTSGTYYEDGTNALSLKINGENFTLKIKGSGSNSYLELNGEAARRINRSDVPTEKTSESGSSTAQDQLSNTSWKLSTVTGWAASAINDYKNVQFRFGANGVLTEWYSNSESYTGTYSISGSVLTISKIPFENDWGSKLDFTISGNKLTLIYKKGHSWETSFVFTKL